MERLYAIGEAACNGVHGRNRLASNSLLESLVFAKRAALQMAELLKRDKATFCDGCDEVFSTLDLSKYADIEALQEEYRRLVWENIEKR